ncbi:MAG: CPBP family intramembrane glutamic endopeptidase [Verrucomicrobiota bacterium]
MELYVLTMLPEKTWKTEAAIRLMLAVLGTMCVGVVLVEAMTKLNPDFSNGETKLFSMVVTTLALHGASLLWVRSFLKEENLSWREAFGFDAPRRGRSLGLAIVAVILVLPVAWSLQQLSVWVMNATNLHPQAQEVVQEMQSGGVSSVSQVYLALVALIGAPLVEEILFRGIMYSTIKRAGYPRIALWGTAGLFALTHANAAAFLALLFFAVILTMLYEETGNLLTPILAHALFNTANFIFLILEKEFVRI